MSINEINRAVAERTAWIEQYMETHLAKDEPAEIEPLRHWSNELYALNSARVQKFSELASK